MRNAELGDRGSGETFNEYQYQPNSSQKNETDNCPGKVLPGGSVGFWVGSGRDDFNSGQNDHEGGDKSESVRDVTQKISDDALNSSDGGNVGTGTSTDTSTGPVLGANRFN